MDLLECSCQISFIFRFYGSVVFIKLRFKNFVFDYFVSGINESKEKFN